MTASVRSRSFPFQGNLAQNVGPRDPADVFPNPKAPSPEGRIVAGDEARRLTGKPDAALLIYAEGRRVGWLTQAQVEQALRHMDEMALAEKRRRWDAEDAAKVGRQSGTEAL